MLLPPELVLVIGDYCGIDERRALGLGPRRLKVFATWFQA